MNKVPITFEYNGKQYAGQFAQVSGAGGTANFYLMINNFYCGQLLYTDKWVFNSNDGRFKELENYFGDYITACLDAT